MLKQPKSSASASPLPRNSGSDGEIPAVVLLMLTRVGTLEY